MMKHRLCIRLGATFFTLTMLAWAPWISKDFIENSINANSKYYEVYFMERIPFGARSILTYTRDSSVEGIRLRVFTLEYTSFTGFRKVIDDDDLKKIKPQASELLLEPPIINRIKEKFPEVKDFNLPDKINRGISIGEPTQYIYGEIRDSAYIIIFRKGWGDCADGCIFKYYSYFEVKRSGEIVKVGERYYP